MAHQIKLTCKIPECYWKVKLAIISFLRLTRFLLLYATNYLRSFNQFLSMQSVYNYYFICLWSPRTYLPQVIIFRSKQTSYSSCDGLWGAILSKQSLVTDGTAY